MTNVKDTFTGILHLLFPAQPRAFPGLRWAKIFMRTIHLMGIAGVGAGILFDVAFTSWHAYLVLTVCSGFALLGLEIWSNAMILLQLRGLVMALKFGLLFLLFKFSDHAVVLMTVIFISSIISHAPGDVRYYSFWHGKRMDVLPSK